MEEMFPIACGLLAGIHVGLIRPAWRIAVGASLAIVLGVAATVVSGEFKVSWAFLLVDIPLVALSEIVAHTALRALRWRSLLPPT